MNSKLVILANEQPLTLGDDFSISVELSNPLFNDNDVFSKFGKCPIGGKPTYLEEYRRHQFRHSPSKL